MPEEYDDDVEAEDSNLLHNLRKQLKEQSAAAESLAAENANLKRESAFRTAGIDPSDPKTRYFTKGYDGEITVEAIQAEALSVGIIEAVPSDIPESEVAAQNRANEIVAGAEAPALVSQQAEYEAEMSQAATTEDVLAIMDKYGSPRVQELL